MGGGLRAAWKVSRVGRIGPSPDQRLNEQETRKRELSGLYNKQPSENSLCKESKNNNIIDF
jgi:hypothetical protein